MTVYESPLAMTEDAGDIPQELPTGRRRVRTPSTRTVLVSLLLVSVGFGGGVLEARHKGVTSTSTTAAQTATAGRTTVTAPVGTGTAGAAAGGTTFGTVKLVDGDTVYLTTASGSVVKVTLSKSTTVQVSKTSATGGLKTGATVVVRGTADASGTVTATSISQSGASPTPAG